MALQEFWWRMSGSAAPSRRIPTITRLCLAGDSVTRFMSVAPDVSLSPGRINHSDGADLWPGITDSLRPLASDWPLSFRVLLHGWIRTHCNGISCESATEQVGAFPKRCFTIRLILYFDWKHQDKLLYIWAVSVQKSMLMSLKVYIQNMFRALMACLTVIRGNARADSL